MPLDGEVLHVNSELDSNPELVNEDPLGEGWFFRFQPADAAAVGQLLDQDAYDRMTGPWRQVIAPIHPDDAAMS